ncbi:bifunctional phosphoribosyl-AMP cyclohydrolase/phosphoribosyl-ATP diphosphatase HisIE [Alkalibacter saccharofermentans]|uniref:Histidine biosynthesis bifunctional protein HisIE n=1 Tax=Alkalibacter saccharofermentans DSM 14828 TaxID=1120975 RepID=A0A1M4TAG1_9FIRM|nr:bifunctional phosphoribosyl-AMP cyclohydrolase/phosphoribosyl-ATP diphosphatase HisIE [Alkalibacter saccharofermentans]SHE41390.1 phosphoribosyl-ATP pyrophosphatase /phosphoribosyl-AMP cyclohydrolase [Alkalibacter saccharofermentans DSM 14828]
MDLNTLKYDEKGLIPAIVQDADTSAVLMMAYMNEESLKKTIKTGTTWFYSRSRQKLWNKGESSGNFQKIISIDYDCDEDTLLLKVVPEGPSCHTGEYSCFYRSITGDTAFQSENMLSTLYTIIKDRRDNPKEGSYTQYLFDKGADKILKKVGEEAAETIIAAKNQSKEELIYETSDLFYHLMVLLVNQGVELNDIMEELKKRHK